MSLLTDLRAGTYGIRFIPPSQFVLDSDEDAFVSFRDAAHRVDWYLEFSPLIVDISLKYDDVLQEDLRIDTIAVFESYFETATGDAPPSPVAPVVDPTESVLSAPELIQSLPRTKREPTWSPVVSVERATFA